MTSDNELAKFIRSLMTEGNTAPTIEEFGGLSPVVRAVAEYAFDTEFIAAKFDGAPRLQDSLAAINLLHKAADLLGGAPAILTENQLHASLIDQFIKRLNPIALAALGVPPKLAVRIVDCEFPPDSAKEFGVEAWKPIPQIRLQIVCESSAHAAALSLNRFYATRAVGIFDWIDFLAPDLKLIDSHPVRHPVLWELINLPGKTRRKLLRALLTADREKSFLPEVEGVYSGISAQINAIAERGCSPYFGFAYDLINASLVW